MHDKDNLRKLNFKDGIKDGIPISVGYFSVAIAFGILSKGAGLKLVEAMAFSFIVYAGASQFIGVSMIAMGASAAEIIIATLFLNFRHFLMSAYLSSRIDFSKSYLKPLIAFFVTDESFSVASFARGRLTESYMLPMETIAYLGWGSGTIAGFLLGSILPPVLQQSMNIGLYALFVALLVPEIKKTRKAIVLAALSGLVNSILVLGLGFPQGWGIVISIVVVSAAGLVIYERYEVDYSDNTGMEGKDTFDKEKTLEVKGNE